jgi:hypothetical protein
VNVTITGDRAANLDLCLALMTFSSEDSFTCHTYCNTGPPFLRCKTNTIPILMHQMCISTNQVSSVVLRLKKLEICKIVKAVKEPGGKKTNKYCAMKLSQIRGRIELCMREIILRFEMNL